MKILADLATQALRDFTDDEVDFDVYEYLMTALLGSPTRAATGIMPGVKSLDKSMSAQKRSIDRLERLTKGVYSSPSRKRALENMQKQLGSTKARKDFIEKVMKDASQKGMISAIKGAIKESDMYNPSSKRYETRGDDGSLFQETEVQYDENGKKTSSEGKVSF